MFTLVALFVVTAFKKELPPDLAEASTGLIAFVCVLDTLTFIAGMYYGRWVFGGGL